MRHLSKFLLPIGILLLPTQLALHLWPSWSLIQGIRVDYLAPTLFLTDIFALLYIALHIRKLFMPKPSYRIALLALSFVLFASINIYMATSPFLTAYKWLKVCEWMLLASVLYKTRAEVKKNLGTWLPLTLLWTCLLALAQWIKGGSIGGLLYWLGERSFTTQTPGIALSKLFSIVSLRPYATLPHPNVLAGFLLISSIVLFPPLNKKRWFWVVLLLVAVVIFLTESYSTWIAAGIVFVGAIIKRHYSHPIRFTRFFFITQLFVLSLILPVFASSLSGTLTSSATRERMELMLVSAHVVTKSPFFGVGLGGFTPNIPSVQPSLPTHFRVRAISLLQPVHNVPLLLLSETGLLGLAGFFIGAMASPLTIPFIAISIISLFDHYWVTLQQTMLLLVFVLSTSA